MIFNARIYGPKENDAFIRRTSSATSKSSGRRPTLFIRHPIAVGVQSDLSLRTPHAPLALPTMPAFDYLESGRSASRALPTHCIRVYHQTCTVTRNIFTGPLHQPGENRSSSRPESEVRNSMIPCHLLLWSLCGLE